MPTPALSARSAADKTSSFANKLAERVGELVWLLATQHENEIGSSPRNEALLGQLPQVILELSQVHTKIAELRGGSDASKTHVCLTTPRELDEKVLSERVPLSEVPRGRVGHAFQKEVPAVRQDDAPLTVQRRLSKNSALSSQMDLEFAPRTSQRSSKSIGAYGGYESEKSLGLTSIGASSNVRFCFGNMNSDGSCASLTSMNQSGAGGLFPKWFDPGHIVEDRPGSATASFVRRGLSTCTTSEEEFHDDCTISPVGHVRLAWDLIAFTCLMVELWITPFELIFLERCDTPQAFNIMSYCVTGFFSLDILLNFFTGVVVGDKLVMSRRVIFWHYVRLWFWLDLLATLPFDLILNAASGGALSVAHFGKAGRTIKTLRYLKLLRVARLVRISEQVSRLANHFRIFAGLQHLVVPLQVTLFLAVYAHIHGCIWASLQPEWVAVDSSSAAADVYFESFWWAYTAVVAGSVGSVGLREPRTYRWGIFLLEMIIAAERLLLGVLFIMRVFFRCLRFIDDARMAKSRTEVLTYLQKNRVSFQTQIQVLFCLTDASKALQQQKFYNSMRDESLPAELYRTICTELWQAKLLSLGLIAEIANWHGDFIAELSQLVSEEVYPTKAVLFQAGDAATAAYYILEGELSVRNAQSGRRIPNFKIGMWVGENALASSLLRRSASFLTVVVTSLMVVSGDCFHKTLSNLGLMEQFQFFCGEHLWRGLCGRCGQLGDHFSDTCRVANRKSIIPGRRATEMHHRPGGLSMFGSGASVGSSGRMSMFVGDSAARQSTESDKDLDASGPRVLSRELKRYLEEVELSWIGVILLDMEVYDLSDLETLDADRLHEVLDTHLTPEQQQALSTSGIRRFREKQASNVHKALFHQVSRLHHLMFLSHYKLEAGTEAALLRTEIEQAIAKDPGSLGHRFEQPVFLDSDDLSNLEDLQQRVCHTHNLVLLLTKGVLTRPWCLIEILTAWREGVRVQPVIITKPGSEFEFPDEAFYTSLRAGNVIDKKARDIVEHHSFTMEQLELAFRNVFRQIAVPYSPHKATNIRQAEVDKLMKNCRLKSEGHDRNSGGDRSIEQSASFASFGSGRVPRSSDQNSSSSRSQPSPTPRKSQAGNVNTGRGSSASTERSPSASTERRTSASTERRLSASLPAKASARLPSPPSPRSPSDSAERPEPEYARYGSLSSYEIDTPDA